MIYVAIAIVAWPLFWMGVKHYGYAAMPVAERTVIVTVLAAAWPVGILTMACLDHAERHP